MSFIDRFRDTLVQIATPYSIGTGFYVKSIGYIVTNQHVVEDNSQVVIDGEKLTRQVVKVVYSDRKYDLALLAPPIEADTLPDIALGLDKQPAIGDPVTALGHPFGLQFSVKTGCISNTREVMRDLPYLHLDVALNPGNSGGPLIDAAGFVLGINTFILNNSESIGFALPVSFLQQVVEEFRQTGSDNAARCQGCSNVITEQDVDQSYCRRCGSKVELPGQSEPYMAVGAARTIERIIEQTGHNVTLSRCGPNAWEIRQGSARINISYHERSGLMSADAMLCRLPKDNIQPLYQYLLTENYQNTAMSLSVREQDVVLSLLIFDRYLNEQTGMFLLNNLFEKADYYDNVLVEQYGATWK